jgi:hypothetical protein
MSAQPLSLTEQEIVFRLDRGFRKRLALRAGMLAVVGAVLASVGAQLGPQMFVLAGLCGAAAAGCVAAYLWRGRFRTVLTPQGIKIRGYFNHFVPWSDIAGFQVHSHGPARSLQEDGRGQAEQIQVFRGSMRGQRMAADRRPPKVLVVVRVVRVKGRRVTLAAPRVTTWASDSEFDDKVRLMDQWRQQYGVPPGVTMPG